MWYNVYVRRKRTTMVMKVVALFTMFSMTINGFLPKSVMDLSRNSFLVDAIACQSVFLDFLHLSDKSLVEIAVKTVDDYSVSMPGVGVRNDDGAGVPWASACRALSQSTEQVNSIVAGLMKGALPVPDQTPAKQAGDNDNTSADYLLYSNQLMQEIVCRTAAQSVLYRAGIGQLVLSAATAWSTPRLTTALCGVRYVLSGSRAPDHEWMLMSGIDAPINMAARFTCILPRSGMDTIAISGVKI